MSRNVIETVMGAVVLVVAGFFLFFAYSTSQVHRVNGYQVSATFTKADGIREGSDVRISGIKVGSVVGQKLDPKTFLAELTLSIDRSVQLPVDTQAQISSSGLLGDKYLSLTPGGEEKNIAPGGRIAQTQPAISIEDMIGQYIFSQSGSKAGSGGEKKDQ